MFCVWIAIEVAMWLFFENVDRPVYISTVPSPVSSSSPSPPPLSSSKPLFSNSRHIQSSLDAEETENDEKDRSASGLHTAGEGWVLASRPVLLIFFIQFILFLNQTALETLITPLTQRLFGWGTSQNSIMYMSVAAEAICVFLVVRSFARHLSDRVIVAIGVGIEMLGLLWLLIFVRAARPHQTSSLAHFIVAVFIVVLGIPFLFVPLPSLLSKLVPEGMQVFSLDQERNHLF